MHRLHHLTCILRKARLLQSWDVEAADINALLVQANLYAGRPSSVFVLVPAVSPQPSNSFTVPEMRCI
jgi:hypothetical protein